jgi:hypothetical protein
MTLNDFLNRIVGLKRIRQAFDLPNAVISADQAKSYALLSIPTIFAVLKTSNNASLGGVM